MPDSLTALILGASRGLGLALAREYLSRGWTVVATIRGDTPSEVKTLVERAEGRLTVETLEMTDPDSVEALRERLSSHVFDLLFVNAGVALGPADRINEVSTEEFTRVMVTNALSPLRAVEVLDGLVRRGGTIAVMSSSLGSVSLNEGGGWEVYRASKAALNMLMRSYAARHREDERVLALVDPGWVRTDMGGASAGLGIEDSIPGVVDALEAQLDRIRLRFFDHKGETVPL